MRQSKDLVQYFLQRQGEGEKLKVDLVNDPLAMMAPPLKKGRLTIDSLEDIAVNKVWAILDGGPAEPKHFCDLYFILASTRFTLDHLIARASAKQADFEGEDGQLAFAATLRRAEEVVLDELKMIRPLSADELRSLLRPQAEAIIRRLRPHGER